MFCFFRGEVFHIERQGNAFAEEADYMGAFYSNLLEEENMDNFDEDQYLERINRVG